MDKSFYLNEIKQRMNLISSEMNAFELELRMNEKEAMAANNLEKRYDLFKHLINTKEWTN